jgi:hypothetical protein
MNTYPKKQNTKNKRKQITKENKQKELNINKKTGMEWGGV